MIDIWYGDEQHFGHLGIPQRWINILGNVDIEYIVSLQYSIDNSAPKQLSIGPDGHRLARPGDFNAELAFKALNPGRHALVLIATDRDGCQTQREVDIVIEKGKNCPLPYHIQWNQVSYIHEAAQIVDGKWALTPQGIRVMEPYYDRVIAFGDLSWANYEVRTTVTFHELRIPDAEQGDAGANVIHAAIATLWPGHDKDEHQPHIKWFPLGSTAEFRVNPSWSDCSWRILGGGGVVVEAEEKLVIEIERPYAMKHRVDNVSNGLMRYRVKLWEADCPEPKAWAVELLKKPPDIYHGGALLIAHYTDVTFGDVEVIPVS